MKYISYKQFKEANKKIQDKIIELWIPDIGDLFFRKGYEWTIDLEEWKDSPEIQCVAEINNNTIIPTVGSAYSTTCNCNKKEEIVPLLTEGQMRNMIEILLECKIDITYDNNDEGYNFELWSKDSYIKKDNNEFIHLGKDLLQAYWIVLNRIIENME